LILDEVYELCLFVRLGDGVELEEVIEYLTKLLRYSKKE
jgi:hypothetical protein